MSEIMETMQDKSSDVEDKLRENVKKLNKLKLILMIIKKIKASKLNVSDGEKLEKSLMAFTVQDFLTLDDGCTLLGLDNCRNINLSYTERRAIQAHLIEKIPEICTPLIREYETMKAKDPFIFNQDKDRKEILDLEGKRRQLYIKLIEAKNKNVELLKSCAQMKLGPQLKNNIEYIYSEYKLNQIKASVLQKYMMHTLFTQTEHAVKAVKEVSLYIDNQLQK